MLYVHDVYVNFFREENPNLIAYFHEWDKKDNVELLDKIPLLQVNHNLFKYVTHGKNEIPKNILETIENKTYYRKNSERVLCQYAFVVTDGNDVMAVELDPTGHVDKKSRLAPRQHQLALDMIGIRGESFELEDDVDVSDYDRFIGLTRYEKQARTEPVRFINSLLLEKVEMLKYLVAEFDLGLHRELEKSSFDEIKNRLLDEIRGSDITRLLEFNKVIGKLKVNN